MERCELIAPTHICLPLHSNLYTHFSRLGSSSDL